MQEYKVRVYNSGTKTWHLGNKRHREDGPAIERSDGYKAWYLHNAKVDGQEFEMRIQSAQSCDGREVEIDGKTYILKLK